jgi:hypothetical protein
MRRIAVVGLSLLASVGSACCITFASVEMRLAKETALIIWDEEQKVEHFVRRAEFDGKAKDFGFILPVPTQPFAIEVADPDVFAKLERLKPHGGGIGCSSSEAAKAASAKAGGVEVLEEKKVGDYDVTVLRATEGQALNDWLEKRGHKMRPAMTPWFDHYARQRWVFVAFKYAGKMGPTPTKAVRVSFKAERPHYPYKMPKDTWEMGHFRPLDLFVIAKTEVNGNSLNDQAWNARKKWSNEVSNPDAISALLGGKPDSVHLPEGLVVTRFENTPDANNYEFDLTFEPAPNRTPLVAGATTAVVVALWWSRRRRRAAPT